MIYLTSFGEEKKIFSLRVPSNVVPATKQIQPFKSYMTHNFEMFQK